MNTQTVQHTSAVIAAVCISVVAMGGFLVLPVLVGAVAEDMGLSDQQVGLLASVVMFGSALSSIGAVFWVRGVDWRRAGYASLGLLFSALTTSIFVDSFKLFVLCQFLGGLGAGAAYSLALTALSDNRHPDRCFGFSLAAQVSFQVVGMLTLPFLITLSGMDGVLSVLAGMALCGLVLLRYLPRSGIKKSYQPLGFALFEPRVLAALAGCFFFFVNVGALWTYVERMGAAAQFEPPFIGVSLAVGVSLGLPGALLAAWCGDRYGRVVPLALGTIGTVTALVLMRDGMATIHYVIALALYNFAWNFSLAFQYAAVTAADDSGRSVAAAPAFHGAGATTGPAVAALFLTGGSFMAVNVVAAGAVCLSFLLFVAASTHRKSTVLST